MNNPWGSVEDLRQQGFVGFKKISVLRQEGLQSAPRAPGVYIVLRESSLPPVFLSRSTGGHFKGKDPTVPIPTLLGSWISETPVVYIGKAGGTTSESTLRTRLNAYLQFGAGARVGHWGGRFIWQLADAEQLAICWKLTPGSEPRDVERSMIADFLTTFGSRPFANRCG